MSNTSSQVIFEFIAISNFIKVSAICIETGKEVSIIAAKNTSKEEMQRLALQKLNYIKNKKLDRNPTSSHSTDYKV